MSIKPEPLKGASPAGTKLTGLSILRKFKRLGVAIAREKQFKRWTKIKKGKFKNMEGLEGKRRAHRIHRLSRTCAFDWRHQLWRPRAGWSAGSIRRRSSRDRWLSRRRESNLFWGGGRLSESELGRLREMRKESSKA